MTEMLVLIISCCMLCGRRKRNKTCYSDVAVTVDTCNVAVRVFMRWPLAGGSVFSLSDCSAIRSNMPARAQVASGRPPGGETGAFGAINESNQTFSHFGYVSHP